MEMKWMCGTTAEVGKTLMDNKERPAAMGKVDDGDLRMTFWLSQEGDWTVVATSKDAQVSCIVFHGTGFKPIRPPTTI